MKGPLMRARCKFCGRQLHYAKIPNRGPVMAHATGDGAACRRLQGMGHDLVSRADKAAEIKAEQDTLRKR